MTKYEISFDENDGYGEYGVHDGFFNAIVTIDNVEYDFQCCVDENDKINWSDCGYNDGICGDCNKKLADKIGWDNVLNALKQAYSEYINTL